MKKLARLREEVNAWRILSQRVSDALELAQMGDDSLRAELEPETISLEAEIQRRELEVMLSGQI